MRKLKRKQYEGIEIRKKRIEKKKKKEKKPQKNRKHSTPPKIVAEERTLGQPFELKDIDLKAMSTLCPQIRSSEEETINLHFSQEKTKIFGDAMLLLYAEIDRKVQQKIRVTCNYPKDRKAEKILQHIGFFKLIGKEKRIPKKEITEPDIASWKVLQGDEFDGEQCAEFIDSFIERDDWKRQRKMMYSCTMELIGNAVEHAYKENDQYKKWTMFGRLSDDKSIFSVSIGDLGRTIPVTVREWVMKSPIKSFQRRRLRRLRSDTGAIKHAISYSQSRYFEKHRGKGLADLIRYVKALSGEVGIRSKKGFYSPTFSDQSYKSVVKGTIVWLNIPLGTSNLAKKEARWK